LKEKLKILLENESFVGGITTAFFMFFIFGIFPFFIANAFLQKILTLLAYLTWIGLLARYYYLFKPSSFQNQLDFLIFITVFVLAIFALTVFE
tara:strand:+ start:566 stop:844 length:279 start_codon:yes stop_codon:yes gene_type:complete